MPEIGKDNGQVIQSKSDVEMMRLRPEAVLGNKGARGATHTVIEIIGNALDERNNGYGEKLELRINPEKAVVSVRDYGRGVPMGWNADEEAYNSFLIFGRENAGGKYESNAGLIKEMFLNPEKGIEGTNLFTIGLNGKGAFATQATSRWFRVESCHGGVKTSQDFREGFAEYDEPEIEETDEADGTMIMWQPDIMVFKGASSTSKLLNMDTIHQFMNDSSLTSGMTMIYKEYGGDGLEEEDLVKEKVLEPTSLESHVVSEWIDPETGTKVKDSSKETLSFDTGLFFDGVNQSGDPIVYTEQDNRGHLFERTNENMAQISMAFAPKYQDGPVVRDVFVNQVRMSSEVGTMPERFLGALHEFFEPRLKDALNINKVPKNVDLRGNVNVVISAKVVNPHFRGQTKDALDNVFMGDKIFYEVRNQLEIESENPDSWVNQWVQAVIESVKEAREQRELKELKKEADKASRNERPSDKHKRSAAYQKKDFKSDELWLVEGNSAGTALMGARDSKTQSLYELRGKGLNVYKEKDYRKILDNSEVKDLMRILSCGLDMPGQSAGEGTNPRTCRTGKIIIASDADTDGFHIRLLVFTMFWKLWRPLVMEGFLYIANTPLYRIKHGKTVEYFFDDITLQEYMAEHGLSKSNSSISRFKGLGEAGADVLSKTTVDPESRDLIPLRIEPDQVEKVDRVLDVFFSDDSRDRKELMLKDILVDTNDEFIGQMLKSLTGSDEDIIEPIVEEELAI